MTKILVDSGLLEQVASSLDFVATNGVPAGGQEANNAEDLYHQATALRAALNAPQQEAVAEVTNSGTGAVLYRDAHVEDGDLLYTHPAPSVPNGWQLVPKKMDDTMRSSAAKALDWFEPCVGRDENSRIRADRAWDAALSAAPKAQTADDRKDAQMLICAGVRRKMLLDLWKALPDHEATGDTAESLRATLLFSEVGDEIKAAEKGTAGALAESMPQPAFPVDERNKP